MNMLVVYSSRTGNTRAVAEAIHAVMPEGTELAPVESAPDPAGYDFIALGFWVDKGMPDAAMRTYMDRVHNTCVGIFGTLGAWPDSDHARQTLHSAVERMQGNTVLGTFLCQGKVDPKVLAFMAKMREKNPDTPNAHAMTDERRTRLAEAALHPNAEDCAAAQNVFSGIVQRMKEKCPL